jgi:hypothetical protein
MTHQHGRVRALLCSLQDESLERVRLRRVGDKQVATDGQRGYLPRAGWIRFIQDFQPQATFTMSQM